MTPTTEVTDGDRGYTKDLKQVKDVVKTVNDRSSHVNP